MIIIYVIVLQLTAFFWSLIFRFCDNFTIVKTVKTHFKYVRGGVLGRYSKFENSVNLTIKIQNFGQFPLPFKLLSIAGKCLPFNVVEQLRL